MFSGQPGAPFPGSTLASWTAQNLEGQVRRTASLITGGIQVGVQSAMNPGSQIVNPAMGAFNTLNNFASNPSGFISAQYNSFTKSLQTPEGIGEAQVNFGVFVASLVMPGEGAALEEAAAEEATTATQLELGFAKDVTEINYLYQKVGPAGEHLKFGVTDDLAGRYTSAELNGGRLKVLAQGSRTEMLRLERSLHETLPLGPEEGQKFYIQIQTQKGLLPPSQYPFPP